MGDAMNACPDCGEILNYNARKCSCGWKASTRNDPAISQAQIEASKAASVARSQRQAESWLSRQGLGRRGDESQLDYLRRLAGYRERLRGTPKPDDRAWARDILQRNEDGEMVPIRSLELAREAVK